MPEAKRHFIVNIQSLERLAVRSRATEVGSFRRGLNILSKFRAKLRPVVGFLKHTIESHPEVFCPSVSEPQMQHLADDDDGGRPCGFHISMYCRDVDGVSIASGKTNVFVALVGAC